MDTKSMPGRHRKKSKPTHVQLVHYRPCCKDATLTALLFPCAASEKGGRRPASCRWPQYTPFYSSNSKLGIVVANAETNLLHYLINDMHFLLPTGERSTLPLCDMLHNDPSPCTIPL